MAYILDSTTIRPPHAFNEGNDTQSAQIRTLNGSISRDYFGSNKRVWVMQYNNVTKTDYDVIKTIYDSYLSSGTAKTFESTETNYTIAQTNVHIDMKTRQFNVRGETYISDFTVILTEA